MIFIHFSFEENALPPLFGKLLMKAILHEHNEISGQINGTKTILASMNLEGMEKPELFSKKSVIQQIIDNLYQ